jgi:hypothetical protein
LVTDGLASTKSLVVTGRREIENSVLLPAPLKISAAEEDDRPRRATYNDPSKPGKTLLLELPRAPSPPLPSPLSSSPPSPPLEDDDDEEEDACTNALPVSNDHKNFPVFASTADTEPSKVATSNGCSPFFFSLLVVAASSFAIVDSSALLFVSSALMPPRGSIARTTLVLDLARKKCEEEKRNDAKKRRKRRSAKRDSIFLLRLPILRAFAPLSRMILFCSSFLSMRSGLRTMSSLLCFSRASSSSLSGRREKKHRERERE